MKREHSLALDLHKELLALLIPLINPPASIR
jgi:hypothetical protein